MHARLIDALSRLVDAITLLIIITAVGLIFWFLT